MSNRYKLILSNKSIYREVDLSDAQKTVRIGTTTGCDIRLSSNFFFTNIELTLTLQNDVWTLTCSDDIYISVDNVRKLMFTQLAHGDHLQIKYRASDNDVFVADFAADFDYAEKDYNRIIDISGTRQFSIGTGNSCDISLRSEFLKNDLLRVENQGDMLLLKLQNSTYGIYKNGQRVTSGSAKIRNRDFFSLGEYSFYYKDRTLFTTENDGLSVRALPAHILCESASALEYPKYNRSTRVKIQVPNAGIPVLDPPQKPQKPKKNLLLTILPSLAMIVMIVLLRGVMSSSGGNNMSYILMSVGMMGMGVVTSVVTHFSSKKEYKQSVEDREKKYNEYIDKKTSEISELRDEERTILNRIYCDPKDDLRVVEEFSGNLFDRESSDDDFLKVRLGTGVIEAERKIDFKAQEKLEADDELAALPEALYNRFKMLENAPVLANFKDSDVIGVIGTKDDCYGLFKNLTLDLTVRHYYKDVKLFCIIGEEESERFSWLRFLPHFYNDEQQNRNIAYDDVSKTSMLEYLYRELSNRADPKKQYQQLVVFVFDSEGIMTHPISGFMSNAAEKNVTFVFFDRTEELLPQHCGEMIRLESATHGVWLKTEDENSGIAFDYKAISDDMAKFIAVRLAPVYCEEVSLDNTLTKSISFYKMLEIFTAHDLDLKSRWEASRVDRTMAAPLGVKTKDEIVYLDLHEKFHGPHGLVAGTTGSGKSEILQSYILSMATLFHPYEVSFLIIDFKGGGMVNQFRELPHLVGAITNIDGKEIDRSLRSIKAELLKRQEYFAEADVNHIDKYIRKYKSGAVTKPLPHLIIIVDEFAELKAEQPDFMKELISAARIGRSLGVHLILATQKPAGQVDDQIWSNSRFKLCLKVQDQNDSNEVLKSPLAAEIKEPGRAYLQVGNNEIFDLFQSAYSGAPENDDAGNMQEFMINEVSESGKRTTVYSRENKRDSSNSKSQLDAIVEFVHDFCEDNHIVHLPSICLPALSSKLPYPASIRLRDGQYPIGIYDDPDSQYQGEAYIDFNAANTFIVGASQTGKTSLLQLIIREICSTEKANRANFYIIDFGSMILKNFESLNHVGGVVLTAEEEKLKNLFKMLNQELEWRKERLLSIGVSSMASYLEAGYTDIPHIYLILDNFPIFKELYAEKFEDDFLFIAREGVAYGITIILTSTSTAGFGFKYMSNFPNRIAFSCNDASEYQNLFDRCRMEPSNTPGRVLIARNKSIYEAQTFQAFTGAKEIERVESIKQFIAALNERNSGLYAKQIPEVPDQLTFDFIERNFKYDPAHQMGVALSYQYVEPVYLDIYSTPQIGVFGKLPANVCMFEKALILDVKRNYFSRSTQLYIIDSLTRELKEFEDEPFVAGYTIDYSQVSSMFEYVLQQLEERYNRVLEDGLEILDEEPLMMLLINNMSAVEFISNSKDLMKQYNDIISKYKAMKVMLVFCGLGDENIGYNSADLLKKIKENKHAFIFTNIGDHKVFDIPIPFIRQNKKPVDLYQGYYIKENEVLKIRFAKEE